MKIERNIYKCAVCGVENEYLNYVSNYVRGYSDFDMKPIGSMMPIGSNIMECPNCHYANYTICDTIEQRFNNNLELWNNSKNFQEIIKNYSGNLRKILLVAKQYENNLDYSKAYKSYIMASWVSDDKEEISNFRITACKLFGGHVAPVYNGYLLQIVDILRMEGYYDTAIDLIDITKEMLNEEDENLLKIINAEIEFIKNKDSKKHKLTEFEKTIENYSEDLQKILLAAKQYEGELNYLKAYQSYINASWVSNDKEESYSFRIMAYRIFRNNILPNFYDNMLQIADILRMESFFDGATELISILQRINNVSDENVLKIINAEIEFIKNKDSKRHNLGEIFE